MDHLGINDFGGYASERQGAMSEYIALSGKQSR
jgi:hypothetical protein